MSRLRPISPGQGCLFPRWGLIAKRAALERHPRRRHHLGDLRDSRAFPILPPARKLLLPRAHRPAAAAAAYGSATVITSTRESKRSAGSTRSMGFRGGSTTSLRTRSRRPTRDRRRRSILTGRCPTVNRKRRAAEGRLLRHRPRDRRCGRRRSIRGRRRRRCHWGRSRDR